MIGMQAGGSLWTKTPVEVIAIEGDRVVVELPGGERKRVRAGEVLVVEAEVRLEREGGNR